MESTTPLNLRDDREVVFQQYQKTRIKQQPEDIGAQQVLRDTNTCNVAASQSSAHNQQKQRTRNDKRAKRGKREPDGGSGTGKLSGVPSGGTYGPFVYENAQFERYYRAQEICPSEEWGQMMEHFKTNLPASVRINKSTPLWRSTLRMMKVFNSCPSENEKTIISLPWMPHNLGWQWTNMCKVGLRKQEAFKAIRECIISEDYRGSLTRQEAVSMLPCLFLDIQPDYRILDMCASPGSKTTELLDMLQWTAGENAAQLGSVPATGYVIANDIDIRRAQTLTHQCNTLRSPCIAVSCFDASTFPLTLPAGGPGRGPLRFDCILADVPCSGDGTLRKNGMMWRTWNIEAAFGLHQIQLCILQRALHLLRVGGQLVYSTCSLNPLEDEAVVATVLQKYNGAVELVPPPALPGLKYSPGLLFWKVPVPRLPKKKEGMHATTADKTTRWSHKRLKRAEKRAAAEARSAAAKLQQQPVEAVACSISGDKAAATNAAAAVDEASSEEPCALNFFESFAQVPENYKRRVRATMFPPEKATALHLSNAVRILPHQNNSGGFFVACMHKRAELPGTDKRFLKGLQSETQAGPFQDVLFAGASSAFASPFAVTMKMSSGENDAAPCNREYKKLLMEKEPVESSAFQITQKSSSSSCRPEGVGLAGGKLLHCLEIAALKEDDKEFLSPIIHFYGLSKTISPTLASGDLRIEEEIEDFPLLQLVRRQHGPKRLYFVSLKLAQLLQALQQHQQNIFKKRQQRRSSVLSSNENGANGIEISAKADSKTSLAKWVNPLLEADYSHSTNFQENIRDKDVQTTASTTHAECATATTTATHYNSSSISGSGGTTCSSSSGGSSCNSSGGSSCNSSGGGSISCSSNIRSSSNSSGGSSCSSSSSGGGYSCSSSSGGGGSSCSRSGGGNSSSSSSGRGEGEVVPHSAVSVHRDTAVTSETAGKEAVRHANSYAATAVVAASKEEKAPSYEAAVCATADEAHKMATAETALEGKRDGGGCSGENKDDEAENARETGRIKFPKNVQWMHAGVRVFLQHSEKQQRDGLLGGAGWRLAQEGAALMARYMRRRVIFMNLDVAALLLLSETRTLSKEQLIQGERLGAVRALDACRRRSGGSLEAGGCLCVICPTEVMPSQQYAQRREEFTSLHDAVSVAALITANEQLHCYASGRETEALAFHLFKIDTWLRQMETVSG